MIYGLDLFSGIGGIALALSPWVKPVAYCEIDPYCQSVLLSRMSQGHLPQAPIWDDVRTFPVLGRSVFEHEGHLYECPGFEIITAGFPCQDVSTAGTGKGLEGERSKLFFEVIRLANQVKPTFVFLENVPAITRRGGLQVVKSLTSLGYDCRWCVISAASVGAPHRRERWFLLAHTYSQGKHRLPSRKAQGIPIAKLRIEHATWDKEPEDEPALLRVADGIPNRMDRTKALGNAVVPAQCRKAFAVLMGINAEGKDARKREGSEEA